jgi:hypothetical protein
VSNVTVPHLPMDWHQFLDLLGGLDALLDMIADPMDQHLRQEAVQQIVMSLSQAYHALLWQDAQHPQLFSMYNPVIKSAAPNPDYMYYKCYMEPNGVYRLSGNRGTSLFVHLSITSGLLGVVDQPGPTVGDYDLDEFEIGENGNFEIIFSAERPAGYKGNWRALDPRATGLNIRQASYDWIGEIDGRFAVERLDGSPRAKRWSAAEIAARLERLAGFPARYMRIFLGFVQRLQNLPVNSFQLNGWSGIGGLATQIYYEGCFVIAPDEALILDTEIPEVARYWSVLLADPLFCTIDWEKCQSSLNGFQARLDTDGRFRAVIAAEDPSVPNWLDTAGHIKGIIQGRWNECSSTPVPSLTRVKLEDLRSYLPSDTPTVTPQQRREALLRRARGAQFRRKW